MNQYWFGKKTFGIGATAISWEGWLVSLAYVGIVVGSSYALTHVRPAPMLNVYALAAIILLSTAGFITVIALKMKGGLGAMWSGPDTK